MFCYALPQTVPAFLWCSWEFLLSFRISSAAAPFAWDNLEVPRGEQDNTVLPKISDHLWNLPFMYNLELAIQTGEKKNNTQIPQLSQWRKKTHAQKRTKPIYRVLLCTVDGSKIRLTPRKTNMVSWKIIVFNRRYSTSSNRCFSVVMLAFRAVPILPPRKLTSTPPLSQLRFPFLKWRLCFSQQTIRHQDFFLTAVCDWEKCQIALLCSFLVSPFKDVF